MAKNLVLILGAPSSEMRAIEKLADKSGVPIYYAMFDNCRVTPATAYRANGLVARDGGEIITIGRHVGMVECAIPNPSFECTDCLVAGAADICGNICVGLPASLVTLNNSCPGDASYCQMPDQYLPVPSVWQVAMWLRWRESLPVRTAHGDRSDLPHSRQGGNQGH